MSPPAGRIICTIYLFHGVEQYNRKGFNYLLKSRWYNDDYDTIHAKFFTASQTFNKPRKDMNLALRAAELMAAFALEAWMLILWISWASLGPEF